MKQTILVLFLGLGLMVLCGCAMPKSAFVPPPGGIYTSYKAPLLIGFNKTSIGEESGEGSTEYVLEPFLTKLSASWGDCSLEEAAREGRLSKVGTADYEFMSVLGIYAKTTVHVYDPALLK